MKWYNMSNSLIKLAVEFEQLLTNNKIKYKVNGYITANAEYEIEANSPEEAIDIVLSGSIQPKLIETIIPLDRKSLPKSAMWEAIGTDGSISVRNTLKK